MAPLCPAMKVLRIENTRVSTRAASAARAAYLKRNFE
jgi:hypothetical protein